MFIRIGTLVLFRQRSLLAYFTVPPRAHPSAGCRPAPPSLERSQDRDQAKAAGIFAFSIIGCAGRHAYAPLVRAPRAGSATGVSGTRRRDTSDSLSGPFGTSPLERAVCGGFKILRNAPRRPRSPPTANDNTHPTDTLFQFTRVLASCGAHGCWR